MTPLTWALIGVAIVLTAAWPLVQRLRHPQIKPVAGYLIFLSVFAMVGGAALGLAAWVVGQLGLGAHLPGWAWGVTAVLLVATAGAAVGIYAIRRQPRRTRVRPE